VRFQLVRVYGRVDLGYDENQVVRRVADHVRTATPAFADQVDLRAPRPWNAVIRAPQDLQQEPALNLGIGRQQPSRMLQ
jgi:hypothetical protein